MKHVKWMPILTVALLLTGCAGKNVNRGPAPQLKEEYKVVNLMNAYTPASVPIAEPDAAFRESQMAFALSLFQESANKSNENVLLSPYSVTQALAMTELGAAGETLSQMEQVLSGGIPSETYRQMLAAYVDGMEGEQLISANSVWFDDKETLTVKPEFLQRNADYFRADVFCTDFSKTDCHNQIAVVQMNNWVYDHTNGQIPYIMETMDPSAVMVLLNAVSFDAEWKHPYNDTVSSVFTDVHGTEQTAEMMYSEERYFIHDGNATGFVKDYAEGEYCFAALLPDEGVEIADYIAGMDAQSLLYTLQNPEEITVYAKMPKFTADYDTELDTQLQTLGMTDAFSSGGADFSEMAQSGNGNIFIGRVLHKTTITVDTQGTKAAAATAVEMDAEGAVEIEDFREVRLNRPFVYMILDKQQMLPVFIGVVNELETPADDRS